MKEREHGRVVEPQGAIHLMENHDEACHQWRESGAHDRILVHIDAHHDMWWAPDDSPLSIANFICPALKERIARELYWVVPDGTWRTKRGRDALRRHLNEIQARYPGPPAPLRWDDRRVQTTVIDRPLVVCTVDTLPALGEPVLLDIDTDYLTIPQVSYGQWDVHGALPWRWPSELVDGLRTRDIRTDLVTIALSVEGGYTPIRWKYLGGELAARLRGSPEASLLASYNRMRQAAEAEHRGDNQGAEATYRELGNRLGAAPHFNLAYLLAAQDRRDEARAHYQRCLALDDSYGTPFSSPGLALYFEDAWTAAERAFGHTLLIEPTDAYAHLGLGWTEARRGRWVEAEARARQALALRPEMIDAYRLLGRSLAQQARFDQAIDAYERSLKLALAGHRPLNSVVATDPEQNRLVDVDHALIHARLARLYARAGDRQRGITGYRIAIAGGYDPAPVRFRLAALFAQSGRWAAAWRHLLAALIGTPAAVRASLRKRRGHSRASRN